MARRLQLTYICVAIFLLVLPLVCSEDEENNGMNNIGELLQKLLKAENERRTMPDDTNVDGSGGTVQEDTHDDENRPDSSFGKKPGGSIETETENDEMIQKIIQDCENQYELLIVKDSDKTGGSCYLRKMNDDIYKQKCQRIGSDAEIQINVQIGPKIEDSTLLSKIKGIDECTGKPVYNMSSVKRRDLDEYEKRLNEGRR